MISGKFIGILLKNIYWSFFLGPVTSSRECSGCPGVIAMLAPRSIVLPDGYAGSWCSDVMFASVSPSQTSLHVSKQETDQSAGVINPLNTATCAVGRSGGKRNLVLYRSDGFHFWRFGKPKWIDAGLNPEWAGTGRVLGSTGPTWQ